MEGILQVAEGFNDVRLAALGELGARQRRLHGPRPKWRGHRTGDEADEEEDDDEEDGQRRSSLRTVMVLFLCATLFLMHWRVSLSPQLEYIEKKRGHWLYPVKQALDTAACPECFDGSVLIPVLMVLYVWGRVIVRVVGWLLVLGTLVAVSYPPYLCWEHRLPWEYDYGAMCRSVRPQCQGTTHLRGGESCERTVTVFTQWCALRHSGHRLRREGRPWGRVRWSLRVSVETWHNWSADPARDYPREKSPRLAAAGAAEGYGPTTPISAHFKRHAASIKHRTFCRVDGFTRLCRRVCTCLSRSCTLPSSLASICLGTASTTTAFRSPGMGILFSFRHRQAPASSPAIP